jgi:hypothetical protein
MARWTDPHRGQTIVETALVLPLFLTVLFGIIIVGIGVFYQQQLTNVAREAARYAAIHSATEPLCPVVPRVGYDPQGSYKPLSYLRCDTPELGWPKMTAAAREAITGVRRADVQIAACWSGYRVPGTEGNYALGGFDQKPPGVYDIGGTVVTVTASESVFVQCSIDGRDPTTDSASIGCRGGMPTTDQASAISDSAGRPVANTVTVYACYVWQPPLAGLLLIPNSVTMRAVITEAIERQQ